MEANAGNIDRATKHFIIAARSGDPESLKVMKGFYTNGISGLVHGTSKLVGGDLSSPWETSRSSLRRFGVTLRKVGLNF